MPHSPSILLRADNRTSFGLFSNIGKVLVAAEITQNQDDKSEHPRVALDFEKQPNEEDEICEQKMTIHEQRQFAIAAREYRTSQGLEKVLSLMREFNTRTVYKINETG